MQAFSFLLCASRSPCAPSSNVYCTQASRSHKFTKINSSAPPPVSDTHFVPYLSKSWAKSGEDRTILTHAVFSEFSICAKTKNTVIRSLISNGALRCPTFQYFGGLASFWAFEHFQPLALWALWTLVKHTKRLRCICSFTNYLKEPLSNKYPSLVTRSDILSQFLRDFFRDTRLSLFTDLIENFLMKYNPNFWSFQSLVCLNGDVIKRETISSMPAGNAKFLMDSVFELAQRINRFRLADAEIGLFCAVVIITAGKFKFNEF